MVKAGAHRIIRALTPSPKASCDKSRQLVTPQFAITCFLEEDLGKALNEQNRGLRYSHVVFDPLNDSWAPCVGILMTVMTKPAAPWIFYDREKNEKENAVTIMNMTNEK